MSDAPDGDEEAEETVHEDEQHEATTTDARETSTDAEPSAEAEAERVPLSSMRERLEAQAATGEGDVDADAPLSDLAEEAQASSEAERSELFEEVDVGDVDPEAVWEAVVEAGDPPEEMFGEPEGASPAEPTESPDEHVIDKREYCQRCEFFCAPPTVACTNEGTEIVELVDSDSFRVRNCPKVDADDGALRSMIGDDEQS